MILYHGSNHDFNSVDLLKSKDRRDFGKGFYTTTLKEQAQQWGYTMFNRFGGEGIFIYEFQFSPPVEPTLTPSSQPITYQNLTGTICPALF